MRKMKLDLDDLAVETFEVVAETRAVAGTVHARAEGAAATEPPQEPDTIWTCPPIPGGCTCQRSCDTLCPSACPTACSCEESVCYECGDTTDTACPTACPTACTCEESICWPCAVTAAC